MTRARMPRPHEVAAARRDPRLLLAHEQRDMEPTWRARGVCRTVDPELFFPAPTERGQADVALALCDSCSVSGACLAWALESGDCNGVWGGTLPRERRAMLIAWRASRDVTPSGAGEDHRPDVWGTGRDQSFEGAIAENATFVDAGR